MFEPEFPRRERSGLAILPHFISEQKKKVSLSFWEEEKSKVT